MLLSGPAVWVDEAPEKKRLPGFSWFHPIPRLAALGFVGRLASPHLMADCDDDRHWPAMSVGPQVTAGPLRRGFVNGPAFGEWQRAAYAILVGAK